MEELREGHSGLYTIHFSNIFPAEKSSSGAVSAAPAAASPPSASPAASASPYCPLSHFTQWHVTANMYLRGDDFVYGGEAKVFSPTPSLSSAAARGVARDGSAVPMATSTDGIPYVPVHQKDRVCAVRAPPYTKPSSSSAQEAEEADNGLSDAMSPYAVLKMEVHLSSLEPELLGLSSSDALKDVVLRGTLYRHCGWYLGEAKVTAEGSVVTPSEPFHMLVKPYHGSRCTHCLDPVYAIGYTCAKCEVPHYCSRECMTQHMKSNHPLLCELLQESYRVRAGEVVAETRTGHPVVAWWRCWEHGKYTILIDPHNALRQSVQLTLNVLRSAKQDGIQYQLIKPEDGAASASPSANPAPSPAQVIELTCDVLREVNRCAAVEGLASLSAACLDVLYYYSNSTEDTIKDFMRFYSTFRCGTLEDVTFTLEEYVSYARTLRSLAALEVEHALRSTLAADFWQRIRLAKEVADSLLMVKSMSTRQRTDHGDDVPVLRRMVTTQQRDTLLLLSKIFVIIATRTPEEEYRKYLDQAKNCIEQCMGESSDGSTPETKASLFFQLAALTLLYDSGEREKEAEVFRRQGMELLQKKKAHAAAVLKQQSGVEEAEQQAVNALKEKC